jgi:hypothetical protein
MGVDFRDSCSIAYGRAQMSSTPSSGVETRLDASETMWKRRKEKFFNADGAHL